MGWLGGNEKGRRIDAPAFVYSTTHAVDQ